MRASTTSVDFTATCSATRPGQNLTVAGSWTSWAAADSFSGAAYPTWRGTVHLPSSAPAPLEYKFVIVHDGAIVRWESGDNRTLPPSTSSINAGAVFNPVPPSRHPTTLPHSIPTTGDTTFLDSLTIPPLDAFETALVAHNSKNRSWRLRLNFVRRAFSDESFASSVDFNPRSLEHLVTVSTYLTFLSTNQLLCAEDNGHHRPNHHAAEAAAIEAALDDLLSSSAPYVPFVARSIYPLLPSHASKFTASVPLTRIRDIAHRGDIPHDMKQEIKHTLQNKIHRCCGPEDIVTCRNLIERVNRGDYNQDFVHQLNVFYGELREFFNASSLDDRLRYLAGGASECAKVADLAGRLLALKEGSKPAMNQIVMLTALRTSLGAVLSGVKKVAGEESLSAEVRQKLRLADCELDGYAFTLFAGVAKEVEGRYRANGGDESWRFALGALGCGMQNMSLSHILSQETLAAAGELLALAKAEGGVDLLRVKAAVDRARKATVDFSAAISDAYTRRVLSLSDAVGVERRAAAVFAEAVVRSNAAFQMSRVADVAVRRARAEIGLPSWDPLFNGSAVGKVLFLEALGDADEKVAAAGGEDVILVCATADGEEDIPACVRGVVLGHSIPHLSHLGVRARQAGVVFVCAEEGSVFGEVSSGAARDFKGSARLVVSPGKGFAGLTEIQAATEGESCKVTQLSGSKPGKSAVSIGKIDTSDTGVLPLTEATKSNSSAKCYFAGRLATIAEGPNELFRAPGGVSVPFGVFKAAEKPHLSSVTKLIAVYDKAVSAGNTAAAVEGASALRSFIESNFTVPVKVVSAIQSAVGAARKNARVMVRSSANCEDLEDMSGAGLYDSISNVPASDASQLQSAILSVWGSLWTRRAASSRAAYGVKHASASMAVLIQTMIPAELSFVAFSHNPVDPTDASSVYIEAAVGMGETLASGATAGAPYRMRVDRASTSDVSVDSLASFGRALMPSAAEGGMEGEAVDYSLQRLTTEPGYRSCIAQRIADVILSLEGEIGGAQDVEGAIWDDVLYIVQARPQVSN